MEPEKDIENVDSQNDAEVNDNDTTDDTDPSADPNFKEYWVKKVETLEATNKKLYARVKGSENKPLQTKTTSDNPDLQSRFEKLELKSEGYNDQESEFILQYGGKKALENPIVKTALEVMREKAQAEKAVVDTTNSGGDIEKKFTTEQLKEMPLEELEKLLK